MADAKPGLGTGIVEALANQLDATIETEGGHPGTTVSIVHAGKAAGGGEQSSPQKAA